MKTLLLFFAVNIITFVASFSSMGSDSIAGYIISMLAWAGFIYYVTKPRKKIYKRV